MDTAILADGRRLPFFPDLIGSSAMKDVYASSDRQSVLCFYHNPALAADPLRRTRLEAILGRYNLTVPRSRGGAARNEAEADEARAWYCWPTDIVLAPRLGFVTPIYPNNFVFADGPEFLRGMAKHGLRFLGTKNRNLLQQYLPHELGAWRNHLALSLNTARAVARLHERSLVHSDLSPANVLIDPTRSVSLVTDIDALVVEGLFPPDVLGTRGYIAPEVLATAQLSRSNPARCFPNVLTDRHALAVLVYQYLLFRHPLEGRRILPEKTGEEQDVYAHGPGAVFCEHPQDDSNRPCETAYLPCAALGSALHGVFLRAFIDGLHDPQSRPTAAQWVDALEATASHLRPCANPNCWHRSFVAEGEPNRCPFCGTAC